jgi:hypothetical protein
VRPRLALLPVILVVALASCRNESSARSSQQERERYLLATFTRTGGFAGRRDLVYLFPDGGFNVHEASFRHEDASPATGPVEVIGHLSGKSSVSHGKISSEQLKVLREALAGTNAIDRDYTAAEGVTDAHEFTLRYRGRILRWSDIAHGLPRPLVRVTEVFDETFFRPQ